MTLRRLVADDGIAVAWDDLGPPDGQPVVLCHGLGAAARQFDADAAFLAAQGYRVLVPDLRGHGRSGKAALARPENYSLARIAADLLAMLEAVDAGPVHWVGNSLGGIVALHMFNGQARRFRTLATFGTAYALDLPPGAAQLIPLCYGILGRRLTAWLTAVGTTRDTEARKLIAEMLREFDPAVGSAVAAGVARYDLTGNAMRTRVPLLLLRGGGDAGVNRALPRTLSAMRGRAHFTLVEVPEGGHCANLDAAAAVRAALLAFWAAH